MGRLEAYVSAHGCIHSTDDAPLAAAPRFSCCDATRLSTGATHRLTMGLPVACKGIQRRTLLQVVLDEAPIRGCGKLHVSNRHGLLQRFGSLAAGRES